MTTSPVEIAHKHHHRAVRFFWGLLIGATVVSLVGNITRALLPYIPHVVVQIGAAAVPPIALLAAVHGIALAVRAGASGRVYCWAVGAVATIGIGAFAVSFLALRDLMQAIGSGPATACIFPAIIDTAVAISTLMLVALGDKPARRARSSTKVAKAQPPGTKRLAPSPKRNTNGEAREAAPGCARVLISSRVQPHSSAPEQDPLQPVAQHADADRASELIASGVTAQPVETVVAVLASHRGGASINAAAKASGINFRTAKADRGGCARAPASTARGGELTGCVTCRASRSVEEIEPGGRTLTNCGNRYLLC